MPVTENKSKTELTMANANEGKFYDGKLSEGNKRDFPHVMNWFGTTGKRLTAGLTLACAFMVVCTAITNLLPEIPRTSRNDRDRFSSNSGNAPKSNGSKPSFEKHPVK